MNEFWRKLLDTVGANSYVASFADPTRRIMAIDTYSYSIDYQSAAAPIGAATVVSETVVMDTDTDFLCCYFSACALRTGDSIMTLNPSLTVQITDESSQRTFFNAATPIALIGGSMGFPFLLTSPRVIRPRTTLRFDFLSSEAITWDGVFFTLNGARIYYE